MSMRENDNSTNTSRSGGYGADGGGPIVSTTLVQPAAAVSPYSAGFGAYAAPFAGVAPVAAPVAGFGTGNDLFSTIAMLSLLGGKGLGRDCDKDTIVQQGCSDIRKDVADIGKEVHVLGNELQAAFSRASLQDQNEFRSLFERICMTEEKAAGAAHAAEISGLRSTNDIISAITAGNSSLKDILFGLSTNMNTQFCNTNHLIERGNADILLAGERNTNAITLQSERNTNAILGTVKDGFCESKTAHLQATIDDLRDERECSRRRDDLTVTGNLLANQTSSLVAAINSQLQRQTSDIIQFGAGNVALPTNTNTQIGH